MDIKQLSKFLIKAKINTYASGGEGGEKILSDGGKEFKFKEGKFEYRDRYFGFNPFIGQEIVWQKEKTIWGMNYYGEIISEVVPAKKIYQFLQEALKKITENKPFRGPDNFKQGDFEYFNKVEGVVENFNGEEKIFYKKQLIYQLNYNGGLIMNK
jgi:hypothetical protein